MRSLKHILCVMVACCFIYYSCRFFWYSGSLPHDIGVMRSIEISGKGNAFGGCGAAIFYLAPGTKSGIEKEGIHYFRNALQARKNGGFHDRYQSWRQTPLPAGYLSEGMWPGLSCSGTDKDRLKAIVAAARMNGSYYSTKASGSLLLVIPHENMVVYTYFD